jgi:hypothetical protein
MFLSVTSIAVQPNADITQRHPQFAPTKSCYNKFSMTQHFVTSTLDIPPQIATNKEWRFTGG